MSLRISLVILTACLLCTSPSSAQVSPESAEKYNEGQELFKKHRYEEALVAFEDAVKLDGNNAQAYRAMGKTYQKRRNSAKAVEAYKTAIQIKPDYLEAYYELGQYLLTAKQYDGAQENFQKILGLDASFQDGKPKEYLKIAYLKQGNLYHRQRNYKKAAKEYENASQLDPTDATVFYNLGLAQRSSRDYNDAESAFSTAVDIDPDYTKGHRALGDLYRITGKNSQAIRSYAKAIDTDPNCQDTNNINSYLNLAKVYDSTKQYDKAVAILEKAVSVAPQKEKVDVLIALGFAHSQKKDFQSAVSSYKRALQVESRNAEAHFRLSAAYLELKEFQSAIGNAETASRSSKFQVPAHVIIGDAYEAWKPDGWQEKAISHYEKGLNDRRYQKYCEDKINRIKNPMGEAQAEGE